MNFANHPFFQFIAQYAYEPNMVYAAIFVMMLASGFGFPIPEEVYIISIGILAYMGANPEAFPPPPGTSSVVNGYEAAIVTTVAVIFADTLVFYLGRIFGRKIIQKPRLQPYFSSDIMDRINSWVKKYGIMAAFLFRFTPGVRFPAHIALGMLTFPAWQFILVDGLAAIISVPTQILLIYHFGEPILTALHKFKLVFLGAVAVIVLILVLRRFLKRPPPPETHPHQ
jgi:membrane protein DedA with SNARE-associated domain